MPVAPLRVQRLRARGWDYPAHGLLIGALLLTCSVLAFAGSTAATVETRLAVLLLGVSFGLDGLLLSLSAGLGLRRRRRVQALGAGQPWRVDHPWNERGITDQPGRRITGVWGAVLLLVLFLVPLHLLVLEMADLPQLGFGAMLLICDVFVLGAAGHGTLLLLRLGRYGVRILDFADFPYRVGGALGATFRGGNALRGRDLDVRLQCIREVRPHVARGGTGLVVHELLHEQRALLTADAEGNASVRFEIPDMLPATDLTAVHATYWELYVTSQSYEGIFLLPVYERVQLRVA